MSTTTQATMEDLYQVPDGGKAKIIEGEIILMSPTGRRPGYAGDAIFVSLWQFAHKTKTGLAVGDNKGFRVNLAHRTSFSPDAAFYIGPDSGMGFFNGPPSLPSKSGVKAITALPLR